MPDYTVQLSGKGGNLGFLVFDAQTTWEKAMEEAGKYLMQQQLVSVEGAVHGAVVIPPCSADAAAADACLQIKEQGAVAVLAMEHPTTVKVPAEGGELEVTFKCEKHMEPDLAAYSRSLGLNPVQRSTFARNLKKEGVYTKSQLRGQTYRSLFKGVGGDNDDEKLLEEKLSAAQARTGGRIPLNNAAEEADKVKEQVAGMKQQLQDARTKMEDAAKAGDADLANQAKAQLDNVLSQLSGIDVESANLSTAQQMSEMNAAIASGGFVNGRSLETRELIAFNGVFRGIDLMTTLKPSLKAQAVSLKPWYAQMSDDTLALYSQLRPEIDSQEFYIESQQASDLQVANGMVDAYGSSAFHTSVNSWQAGIDITSSCFAGGGSGGDTKSKSSGQSKQDQDSQSKNLQKSITALAKTQYFFQPKLLLYFSQGMLQMSDEFTDRCHRASYALCKFAGRENCSKWIDSVQSNANASSKPSDSSIQIRFVVTNVSVLLILQQTDFKEGIKDALGNAVASMSSGANISDIDVELSIPDRSFAPGGDIYSSMQVKVTIRRATMEMYGGLEVYEGRGFLQPGILSAFLSYPYINQVRIVETNSSTYKKVELDYFQLHYSPLSTQGADSGQGGFTAMAEPLPDATADEVVPALMYDFGSHICPHVTLGGWWRVTANYASTVNQEKIDVERATSEAMEKARAEAWGLNANAAGTRNGVSGGAAGGGGRASGDHESHNDSSGNKDVQQQAMKNATMQIEQTWKGGAPGVSPSDWRRSLDFSMSSNWKVIQRDLTRCIGVWSFVDDPDLADALCARWIQLFMQAQNLTRTQVPLKIQQAACSTTQNMQYLIQYTHNASSWKKQQAADKCEAEHPGYYYTPAGKCLPKQCYCTIELDRRAGTRGVDCPENGKTDCEGCCTPQQRSYCTTNACASGFIIKKDAGELLCQLSTCTPTFDNSMCCTKADVGSKFLLTFKVSSDDDCGTDSDIYGWLTYRTGKGAMKYLSTSKNDFKAGEEESFVYSFETPQHPLEICVYNEGGDELCLDSVKIANDDSDSPMPLGITTGWPSLSSDDEDHDDDGAVDDKCIPIVYNSLSEI